MSSGPQPPAHGHQQHHHQHRQGRQAPFAVAGGFVQGGLLALALILAHFVHALLELPGQLFRRQAQKTGVVTQIALDEGGFGQALVIVLFQGPHIGSGQPQMLAGFLLAETLLFPGPAQSLAG
jgi:hypothetical protein